MSLREEQCKKVCRILDNVLANRPTERDSLIVATREAFKALEQPKRIRALWENKGKIRAWDVCGIETFGVKRKCTNCGFVHIFIEDHGHYPYCPICRADME